MFIKISNLSDGVHNYSFNKPIEKIELDQPFYGNFTANVELSKLQHQLLANVEIILNVEFCCDRCNVNYFRELNAGYKMVYIFGQNPLETESANVTYLPVDTDKIKLKNDLRDYSLLAVPMKKLCKEDCQGLCIKCGKNLNEGQCGCSAEEIDQRWFPLMELKRKLNSN